MRPNARRLPFVGVNLLLTGVLFLSPALFAQNGLSDERVSLPDGPGSIVGVGENLVINPNMGSASFSVPVRVPKGESVALTPRLALSYSSSSGQGLLGIGWDISQPSIERMISRGLPEYTVDDKFAANGSDELVFVGLEGDVREYRARYEKSFVRYRWYDVGQAGYWTAEYPDGRIGTFGATSAGVLVSNARVANVDGKTFKYHLVDMRDTSGRHMLYTYVSDDGWPRVDEIQYGFGPLTTPRFSVRFGYDVRPDVISNATSGAVISLRYRVEEVTVSSLAQVIRRYALAYEDVAQSGGVSRLKVVSEFGKDGGLLPIEHTFSYSRSLSGACDSGCESPFVVDMGTLPGGVDIQTGRASLIDINGDSLPDIVSSDELGAHTFHVASLAQDGRPSFDLAPLTSTMGDGNANFILGAPSVQLLDINGDGFTDIVHQQTGAVLCNFGNGDWESENCSMSADQLPPLPDDANDAASESDPKGMRFFDYDNDKRIDLLRTPSAAAAFVERNTGAGYQTITIDAVGAEFDVDRLQLTDINGDGLQDPIQLVANGNTSILRYQLNLGFGKWAAPVEVNITGLSESELDLAALEDLDGDGLADIAVVAGTTVSYWRNENDGKFSARIDLVSDDVNGDLPERDGTQTVLFADMNGNGTDDIVWVKSNGNIQFLELFPVRPNLLSRVDNGIGWVRTLTYTTSIAERARDLGTVNEWTYKLPNSMVIVKQTDTFVTLLADDNSGLHEVNTYQYRQGYYDGAEKAFRGFANVEAFQEADRVLDRQDPGRQELVFEVGVDDSYRFGLQRSRAVFGGENADTPLQETRNEFADCLLTNVPVTMPAIRYICPTVTTTIYQEGKTEAEWKTTQTEQEYDGYGNVIETRKSGVVHLGPPENATACEVCSGPANVDSGACGAQCLGDEQVVTRTFVVPGTSTNDRWLLRLPSKVLVTNMDGNAASEVNTYYDGADFIGLDAGQADRGLPSRSEIRVDATTFIPMSRTAYDALGNAIAVLDPNGSPDDPTQHRRDYVLDERGLRVLTTTIRNGDYDLVRETLFEDTFLKPSEATAFFVKNDDGEQTPRNATRFRYDEFGRTSSLIRPGDSENAPTWTFDYQLGSPTTKVISRGRRVVGGPADVETIDCYDGRGRKYQSRRKVGAGEYLVNGFNEINARGAKVRTYQPYSSNVSTCEAAPPADVAFTLFKYDTTGRVIEVTEPDASLYGGVASTRRMEFAPLATLSFDANDTDASSPHFNTPLTTRTDGLGRTLQIERMLSANEVAIYRFGYDSIGNLSTVIDPLGNQKNQTFDLASRMLRIEDPNAGVLTMTHDPAGNVVEKIDARGVKMGYEFDGMNRQVSFFDVDNRDATEEITRFDFDADCTSCRNGAGKIVGLSWPSPIGEQSERRGYDPRGRGVFMSRTLDGVTFDTTSTFDGLGSLLSTTYPDGTTVQNAYDVGNRPVSMTDIVASSTYDARGNLESITRGNGVVTTRTYDVLQRPLALSHGSFYQTQNTHDRQGNLLSISSTGTGISHAGDFAYDAWYRLTEATVGSDGEVVATSYDLIDNIVSKTSSLATSAAFEGDYTYDVAHPNQLMSTDNRSYDYDAAGQMTERDDVTMTWDFAGRLSTANKSGADATFRYASGGTRVSKAEHGGLTLYPTSNVIIRDGISSIYVKFSGHIVARLQSDSLATDLLPDGNSDGKIDISDVVTGIDALQTRYLRSAARRLLFAAQGPKTYVHANAQGSLIALTNDDGDVAAERSFYCFGEERELTAFVDDIGFTGQEKDEFTGLHHFKARMLDATAGRWASPDPLFIGSGAGNIASLGESTTAFAYVGNNPANFVDPTGLKKNKTQPAEQWKRLKNKKSRKIRKKNRIKKTIWQVVTVPLFPLRIISGVANVTNLYKKKNAMGSVASSLKGRLTANEKIGSRFTGASTRKQNLAVDKKKRLIKKGGLKGALRRVGAELNFVASIGGTFVLGATTQPHTLLGLKRPGKIYE